jgi:hypothetical protein
MVRAMDAQAAMSAMEVRRVINTILHIVLLYNINIYVYVHFYKINVFARYCA